MKKRMTIRLTAENRKYLCEVAWRCGGDITTEVNRIIAEVRLRDSTETATTRQRERTQ